MRKKLLKNRSVRVKMTLMLIIIMTSVILLSVLINLTMLKTYYTVKEKKTIKESYYQTQKVFQKDTVRKNDVDEIAKTYNYRVLISDGSGTIVYSSEGEKSLMYKSLWNILNENLDKISNQIKKQGYAVMTNTNKSMGTSINLMGYLDGDYTVIISTPMESIQTSARLSGQFTMYVGLILIICGAVAMYLYSRQFTRPIEDMAKAANQMSHLDFDVKVPTGSDDELGRLGASINELSSKLEFTISELKTANNELQKDIEQKVQIDEMRKEFLSHVSHELKTPMTAIIGYADTLLTVRLSPKRQEIAPDYIRNECRRLSRLSVKMLELTGLYETGEAEFVPVEVQMNQFLEDVKKLVTYKLQEKKICLEIHCNPEELRKTFDPDLMMSAVTNFIDNAVKASDENSKIVLEATQNHLSVQDYGKGIPKEDLKRVTEAFYMVDKSRSRVKGSVGLGLALCQKIADIHGFQLEITSHLGKGTIISVLW